MNNLIIEGRNAVLESLNSGRSIDKILVLEGSRDGSIKKILSKAKDNKIVIQRVKKEKLDTLSNNRKHQGVIAFVAAYNYVEVDEILKVAKDKGEDPFIIMLDNIVDPHNFGAILRTANIVGAHGVIIPSRRAVGLTSIVAKTSAGAVEYTKVAKVTNLSRTIEKLKDKGLWFACADMDGKKMYDLDLKGSICLVIGGEGEGVSKGVKDKCDFVASIPMRGQITSLNASVAASVLMYEIVRQRMS